MGKRNLFAKGASYSGLQSRLRNQSDADGGQVPFGHSVQFQGLVEEKSRSEKRER